MSSPLKQKKVLAWAMYDWANSAFATTVMVVFFPLFFKQHLTVGQDAATSTFWLGMINGVSSFLLAVMAPWLGALADKSAAHVRLLGLFTAIGVIPTALLAFVSPGDWTMAAVLFAVASLGFWGTIIFYDSMLVHVAPRERMDSVSGFGYALGYLGGGLLVVLNVLMYAQPAWFGLASPESAIRASFLTVAAWWVVFAIPLFLNPPTAPSRPRIGALRAMREGFTELAHTFREIRAYRAVWFFLLAYWLYIDGAYTVMKMAVDFGLALGFPANTLIVGIVMIQFIGFPATWLFGWLADRTSPLIGIFIAIAVYAAVTIYGAFMTNITEFYVMAAAIGCVQGAIQALSRSYFGALIPPERSGQFFGFYNMMGKFASVVGPPLMGVTALLTGTRASISSLIVLFIGGAVMLLICARQRPAAVAQPAIAAAHARS